MKERDSRFESCISLRKNIEDRHRLSVILLDLRGHNTALSNYKDRLKEYTYISKNFEYKNNELIKLLDLTISMDTNITGIDLSPLNKVTTIGDWFLSGCQKLREINLSPLNKVTRIGCNFMQRCGELQEINLSPLNQVTTIESWFMSYCYTLKTIDLSPLNKVTKINYGFLLGCAGLQYVDLSKLNELTQIDDDFLFACNNLVKIYCAPAKYNLIFNALQEVHKQKLWVR